MTTNSIMASTNCSGTTGNNSTSATTTIVGHYELKRTLGKGNFSTVKLARHRITRHLVAIKIVKTSVLSEDNLVKLNREIDVLKKLGKHDHIVRLYQVIKTKRYFMLVTEYCPNGELYDYLVKKSKLSEPKSCDYFLQILSAIEYLHDRNIVHRDLKAENLLLTNDCKTVKIADFGFANYFKHDKLLSTWCGSPPYAAPELFKGLKYVGPPVDIWSMGVILYILVCGSLPFDGHDLVYLKNRVLSGKFRVPFFMSTECESLIRGMLRLDPERRFSVRQIKAHCWIAKHSKGESGHLASNKETSVTSNSLSIDAAARTNSTVFMDTNSSETNSTNLGDDPSKSLMDKNSTGRGQSLDLDDDKKVVSIHDGVKDASMLCLDGGSDKLSSSLGHHQATSKNSSKAKDCVDAEMANAVSILSLESNNSSMSVSQSVDMSTQTHTASRSTLPSQDRALSKENSMDEQILNYMVDNLKVADSLGLIKESIKRDGYDDLHAIYRLLRDQPQIIYEAQKEAQKFKIPSLPLMSINKQQGNKKPSITTGFFNSPSDETYTRHEDCTPTQNDPSANCPQFNVNHESQMVATKHTNAINLSKPNNCGEVCAVSKPSIDRQRKSEDRTWTIPPQLFLTPPSENIGQPPTSGQSVSNDYNPMSATDRGRQATQVARHSFDSNIQQLNEAWTKSSAANDANQLVLTNNARHGLWDSSILDTLGMSTPAPEMKLSNGEVISNYQTVLQQGVRNPVFHERPLQIVPNYPGVTTNLPQIGTNTAQGNQNMLLAQLNSLALSAAVTQSSILTQDSSGASLKFAPNNMMMGHNCNIASNIVSQNTTCIPNLSLLNPNGLLSGLERRASDGQASYNSLTATNQMNEPQNSTPETSRNISPEQASLNLARAFLSSSSNQLARDKQSNRGSFDQSNQQLQVNSVSNNSMRGFNIEQHPKLNDGSEMISYDENGNVKQVQVNPLDLTKGSNATCQQELIYSSNASYSQMFDSQQFGKPTSQRSHSTTSASVIFQNYHTVTPSRCSFVPSHSSSSTQPQISPSSISLTKGGPGHLLNRRKRHSLETESRHHHHQQQQQHQNSNHQNHLTYHHVNSYNESSRSMRHASSNQQYLRYPINSHIGQLRNFALTFSYKNLTERQSPFSGWNPTLCKPHVFPSAQNNPDVECPNRKDTR